MTDKQIIIDGVDVSGCKHIDADCFNCEIFAEVCHEVFPNCYYKQLKRAEQRIVELNKTIQAKEQECEELKTELASTKGLVTVGNKQFYDMTMAYDKATKKLEKIKEHLATVSYLAPFSTRVLKHSIKQIIEE